MGNDKRTILKHIDPSKETWNKSAGYKIKKHLKDRVRTKSFALNYKTDSIGTVKAGS